MRRPTIFLMLAVMAAFLAAVVVFSALRAREAQLHKVLADQVNIVVAASDIPIGAKIRPAMLKLASWSAGSVPAGAFTNTAALANAYARTEFLAGEPIIRQRIFSGGQADAVMPLLIPRGMRAMSVPVDAVSDIAGFVKPHTRVDVLVAISGNDPNSHPFSKIVLQDVQVLAVAQELGAGKDKPKVVRVVTLLVTPHQAERLTLASRQGTLRLAMRNYTDTAIVATAGSDLADLLGRPEPGSVMVSQSAPAGGSTAPPAARPRRGYSIEIMRNGKQAETVSFVNQGVAALDPPGARSSGFSSRPKAPARTAMTPARDAASVSQTVGFIGTPKTIEIP